MHIHGFLIPVPDASKDACRTHETQMMADDGPDAGTDLPFDGKPTVYGGFQPILQEG